MAALQEFEDDWLRGGDVAADAIFGGEGDDLIRAVANPDLENHAPDILVGDAGNDVIIGGDGADTLNGDAGGFVAPSRAQAPAGTPRHNASGWPAPTTARSTISPRAC